MDAKIYCKDCVHRIWNYDDDNCGANTSIYHTYKEASIVYAPCIVINENNDCSKYEKRLRWFDKVQKLFENVVKSTNNFINREEKK